MNCMDVLRSDTVTLGVLEEMFLVMLQTHSPLLDSFDSLFLFSYTILTWVGLDWQTHAKWLYLQHDLHCFPLAGHALGWCGLPPQRVTSPRVHVTCSWATTAVAATSRMTTSAGITWAVVQWVMMVGVTGSLLGYAGWCCWQCYIVKGCECDVSKHSIHWNLWIRTHHLCISCIINYKVPWSDHW